MACLVTGKDTCLFKPNLPEAGNIHDLVSLCFLKARLSHDTHFLFWLLMRRNVNATAAPPGASPPWRSHVHANVNHRRFRRTHSGMTNYYMSGMAIITFISNPNLKHENNVDIKLDGSHGMPLQAMACLGMLWHALACHGLPWHALACHGMPWHVMACHGMPWHAMACPGMPWHAMACHAMVTISASTSTVEIIGEALQRVRVSGCHQPRATWHSLPNFVFQFWEFDVLFMGNRI